MIKSSSNNLKFSNSSLSAVLAELRNSKLYNSAKWGIWGFNKVTDSRWFYYIVIIRVRQNICNKKFEIMPYL